MRSAACLTVLAMLSSCALFGPSKEDHPRDVETSSAPKIASGSCEGDTAPTLAPESLFVGRYQPSATRPVAGAIVAFEGVPRANLTCTQRGCEFECCDNGCGADRECAYALTDATGNEVCLEDASFTCGGTDCSPFCEPFSHAPTNRYRFVGRVEYREASLGQTPVLHVERYCVTSPAGEARR